jgi:hypothetical protein
MTERFELILDCDDVTDVAEFVQRLKRASGKWRIKMNRARPGRTYQQLKYYWAAHMTILFDHLNKAGWKREDGTAGTKEDLHEMMKEKFLRVALVDGNGEVFGYRTRSTGELSVVEMMDFMENVAGWIADQFGIRVPPPEIYLESA